MKARCTLCGLWVALAAARLLAQEGTGVEVKPGERAARMEAARLEVATLRSNIVLTMEVLDRVRTASDRQAQFRQFEIQLARLEEQTRQIAQRARAMKQRGDAYFADWEARTAEIQDPEKRRDAQSRYGVRKRSYDRITSNLQQARAEFDPLLADLGQIQKLLSQNPDVAKVAAARKIFLQANWRCLDVQRSLMEAEIEFNFLAADFAQNEK